MMLRVAVIGSGPAGLITLRHLKAKPHLISPVVYEQLDNLGGLWYYRNADSLHPSVYKNVKTNLPKEIMQLPDFAFKDKGTSPSFVGYKEIWQYLRRYAERYDLDSHIRYNTRVLNVHPKFSATDSDKIKWNVTTKSITDHTDVGDVTTEEANSNMVTLKDLDDSKLYNLCDHVTSNIGPCELSAPVSLNRDAEGSETHDVFDAVIISSGHFVSPYWPVIPGLEIFQGRIIHSRQYRDPKEFRKQTVICVGASYSGKDISEDLQKHAKHVYMINKEEPLHQHLPAHVSEKTEIVRIHADGVELVNGELLEADAIIMCTGYRYRFPFLSFACHITTGGETEAPRLWKHVVTPGLPSLFFTGIPKFVSAFPLYDCQAQFILRILDGTVKLPGWKNMLTDMEEDVENKVLQGLSPIYDQSMGDLQWDYHKELANIAGLNATPAVYSKLFHHCINKLKSHYFTYRNENYVITNDTFKVKDPMKKML